jgi:hypothetical protein
MYHNATRSSARDRKTGSFFLTRTPGSSLEISVYHADKVHHYRSLGLSVKGR